MDPADAPMARTKHITGAKIDTGEKPATGNDIS
jgi:hypothetical protein